MQKYSSHTRYYPLHHFVLYPLVVFLFVWTVWYTYDAEDSWQDKAYYLIQAVIFVILAYVTRVYAIKNQNRIIKTEVRQRFYELSGKSFSEKESQLKTQQIVALRFASDEELLSLVDRAIEHKLSNRDIKLAIVNWKADNHRV